MFVAVACRVVGEVDEVFAVYVVGDSIAGTRRAGLAELRCKSQDWFFFFFSSRRRHTRLQGDWSSDVCSSDLSASYSDVTPYMKQIDGKTWEELDRSFLLRRYDALGFLGTNHLVAVLPLYRSEERRVGKECRSRWSPYH